MDTQGSELLVLQGAQLVLEHFRFIKTLRCRTSRRTRVAPNSKTSSGSCRRAAMRELHRDRFATRAGGGSYFDAVYGK